MASKKHGLGRGLDALLMGVREKQEMTASAKEREIKQKEIAPDEIKKNGNKDEINKNNTSKDYVRLASGLSEVNIDRLSPGKYQPRQKIHPEELESLADSIRVQGILQPLVVRPLEEDRYEIIAGERRFRAAQLAGLVTVPVIVKDVSNESAMAIALIENIQRENLNPLEEAIALDRLSKEFKLTHIQVAEAVGKSRATITNSLRLLLLTEEVKALLEQGEIEVGHAKVLLALKGKEQTDIARTVVAKDLSVRETERLVANVLEGQGRREKMDHGKPPMDPDVKRLQDNLSLKLGAKVEIQHHQGKGKLVIQYNTLEELDGILEHIT